jgi:hypothetical protein
MRRGGHAIPLTACSGPKPPIHPPGGSAVDHPPVSTPIERSSATAESFKACANHAAGNYTSKECTPSSKVAGTGKYELTNPAGDKFSTKGGASAIYVDIPYNEEEPWAGGTVVGTVSCKKSKGTGEYLSQQQSQSTIEFQKCESSGKRCSSSGAKAGSIVGTFVAEVEGSEIAWDSQTGPAGSMLDFNCEGLEVRVTGSVVQRFWWLRTGPKGVA